MRIVEDSELNDPRLTAMGLLIEAHAGLVSALGEQLGRHGLPGAEFDVLLRLTRSPGGRLRMSDLASQVTVTSSGLTRLVDRLERIGLVERVACPTDRRGSFAAITKEGRRKLAAALPGHLELIDRWFTGRLGRDELGTLTGALRTVRDAVHPGAAAGADGTTAPR